MDVAQQALKSRAEVQLLSALNHKKAKSASGYLKAEQERVEAEEEQQIKRHATQNLKQFRVGAGKNMRPPSEQDEMIAAVRQLEHDVVISRPEKEGNSDSPNQIELNAIHRREKHMQAQRAFSENVRVISEDIEVAIIKEADAIKGTLANMDTLLAKKANDLENESLLLNCELSNVMDIWATVETTCQGRTKAIEAFGVTLEGIERSRVNRVGTGLKQLTKTLMETAHALPPEIERIIESEAYDVDVVVITNRRVYADLIARMATQDVDVFVRSRLQWERGLERWRRLRHDDAIRSFHAVISSAIFTDPSERRQVMGEIRTLQEATHRKKRVAALQTLHDAGADLTSVAAQHVLTSLMETERDEDEENAAYFGTLTRLHDEKVREAQALREALRLELHGFGALTPEGDIVHSREKLVSLLSDDSLEDFFRLAGGLKNELDSVVKRLEVSQLIYQGNLRPLRSSLGVLLSALPLDGIMESQGKSAERKAIQATLDKMRKAAKHEIVALLPSLQAQVSMLLGLADVNDVFKAEVEDAGLQLNLILQEFADAPGDSGEIGDTTTAPEMNRAATSGANAGGSSIAKSLGSTSFGTASHTSIRSESGSFDLSAIRRVQRRLGMLVYATELSPAFQEHLAYTAAQLELQEKANDIVDSVVSASCEEHLAAREEESKLFLKLIGERVEHQSLLLHDQCERLAKFYLRVAQMVEQGEERVRFVNLSVMDLLDTLKEIDEDASTELESLYSSGCARLRHAPDSAVLQEEFANASELLHNMEDSYRLYQKQVALAAENHVIATHKQHDLFLSHQCTLFGLVSPSAPESFDTEKFLSLQFIDDATLPKPPPSDEPDSGENSSHEASGESPIQEAASHLPVSTKSKGGAAVKGKKGKTSMDEYVDVPPKEMLKTTTGLELEVQLQVPDLLERILTERGADDGEVEQAPALLSGRADLSITDPLAIAPAPTTDAEDTIEQESEEQITTLEARELRLKEVEGQVLRDFRHLEVEQSFKLLLLETFRVAVLTKFDVRFRAHLASAAETQAQRLAESNLLLEERLRMHWPRKGRLDVQIYQPRIGELYNHRQRLDRHIHVMTGKVDSLQSTFDTQAAALQKTLEDTRFKQVTLQAQLPLQQSLAALQGLEVKAKKLIGACRTESTEMLEKLRILTANDAALLTTLVQDYVRMCSAQVFMDLTSCEVISGSDFHPQEIMIIQSKLQAVETKLRETVTNREAKLVQIDETRQKLLDFAQEFKNRYQTCMQSLSMREGLGQKYGLPRRSAQEKYRSETTRADELSAKIDELLASLQSVVERKQTVEAPRLPDHDIATQILHLLVRLRAKLFYRGKYFGLLKNVSQLEPLPVSFEAGGVRGRPVITDRDIVEEEYAVPPAIQFLDFVNQVAVNCREDTRQLYQQEGKLDDLPVSGVPAALEEYLSGLNDKARAYVLHQEAKLREQVDLFGELLALAPDTAISDFLARSRTGILRSTFDIHEEMQKAFQSWVEQKNRHMVDLRPNLCSPNNASQLQALCDKEAQRSEQTLARLRACRATIFNTVVSSSSDFEKELLALCTTFTIVLDTSVMTLDDLRPFTGEELSKSKRKSLKRLRKLARIQEFGDPREVKRSDEELKKLTLLGEVTRFPRRAWPGIPSFGLHTLWDSLRAELVQDDVEMHATADASLAAVSIEKAGVADGACTALLTHAHRCLVHARDQVYTEFAEFCTAHSRKLLEDLQERLRDEVKWTESWQVGIARLRGQASASSASEE